MKTYDVFGLGQLINSGLSRRLDLIENAINRLDANLEPIAIVENFAFVINQANAEMYRLNYSVTENVVSFSDPTQFNIEVDNDRLESQSKKIVRNIIEALADDDDSAVDYQKAQLLANQRQRRLLESQLELTVGTKSEYINNAKKLVSETVSTTRGAKGLLSKGTKGSLFGKLIRDKEIDVVESEPTKIDAEASRKKLTYSVVIEARHSALSLTESPVFTDHVLNMYNDVDADESVEFVAENYQEIFTLSLSEQTELFYAIVENSGAEKPSLEKIVSNIMSIGVYAYNDDEIANDIRQLSELIGADNGNFHERMQLIEKEINTNNYTANDIKILQTVLEAIIQHPSEWLAPEFVVEARRAYTRVNSMVESGNIDDATVASAIHLVSQFYPTPIKESKKGDAAEYKAFFEKKLEKYGVKSPAELDDDKKKEFFNEIEKEWTGEGKEMPDDVTPEDMEDYGEANIYGESVNVQTGFPEGALEKLLEENDEDVELDDDLSLETIKESIEASTYEELIELEKQLKALRNSLPTTQHPDADDLLDKISVNKLTAKSDDISEDGTPDKVKEIADALKKEHPDWSDEKKFKIAWATYKESQ